MSTKIQSKNKENDIAGTILIKSDCEANCEFFIKNGKIKSKISKKTKLCYEILFKRDQLGNVELDVNQGFFNSLHKFVKDFQTTSANRDEKKYKNNSDNRKILLMWYGLYSVVKVLTQELQQKGIIIGYSKRLADIMTYEQYSASPSSLQEIPKNDIKKKSHSKSVPQVEPQISDKKNPIIVTTGVETNAELSFEKGKINLVNGVEKTSIEFEIMVDMISPDHLRLDMHGAFFDSILEFVKKIQNMCLQDPKYRPKSQKENEKDNQMLNSWFRLHMAIKDQIMAIQKQGGMVSYSKNLGNVMNFKSCLNSLGLKIDY